VDKLVPGFVAVSARQERPARLLVDQINDLCWKFMMTCWAVERQERPVAAVGLNFIVERRKQHHSKD
jgi:hypothetical protein